MSNVAKALRTVLIPADGSLPVRIEDKVQSVELFQGVVGGTFERIGLSRVLTDDGVKAVAADVMVNEEGKLIGLPINPRATDLCALATGGWFVDEVRGDVIVVGPPNQWGGATACPKAIVKIIEDWGWDIATTVREI